MSRAKNNKENRSKVFSVRSKPTTYTELSMIAEALGLSPAEFAAQLIEEGVDRYIDPAFLDNYIAQRLASIDELRGKLLFIAESRTDDH